MSRVLEVQFVDTLMRWTGEYHVQSGDRVSTFYFRVPNAWVESQYFKERIFAVAQKIYEDLNENFHEADPSDLGYLLVKETLPTALDEEQEREAAWMTAENPAAWEWTPCIVVDESGAYTRVSREDF